MISFVYDFAYYTVYGTSDVLKSRRTYYTVALSRLAREEKSNNLMPSPEEKLEALLHDLHELENYLRSRGEKTLALSQQFAQHAKKDPSNREFDLNQSRMLDYQHTLWHEIGNLVAKAVC